MKLSTKLRMLHKIIKKNNNIYIMGHSHLDLDAIASCLGFYEICLKMKKKPYIIINDKKHEAGVKKILDNVKDKYNIITSKSIKDLDVTKKDLLVLVDVNKPMITQAPEVCDIFQNIVVIDHHEKNENSCRASFEIVLSETSSTSEILTKFLYFYDIIIPKYISTCLLSGIVLDTNNFTVKTFSKTYLCAHYLMELGADNNEVQFLLKQDLDEYLLRQRVITDTEIVNKNIAIAVGSQRLKYKREEIAKIADTLLEFNHIELSFVIAKLEDGTIGISGRSIGKVSVGKILEHFNGGGDKYEAACKITDKSLREVEEELKEVIS